MITEEQLSQILPQKYPFRMIDRVIDFKKGESLPAIKNITGNEWIYGSMTPMDIFPETLIIEVAAQTAIAFYQLNSSAPQSSRIVLGRVEGEFFEAARVGDQLHLQTRQYKMFGSSGYMDVDVNTDSQQPIAVVKIFYSVMA